MNRLTVGLTDLWLLPSTPMTLVNLLGTWNFKTISPSVKRFPFKAAADQPIPEVFEH